MIHPVEISSIPYIMWFAILMAMATRVGEAICWTIFSKFLFAVITTDQTLLTLTLCRHVIKQYYYFRYHGSHPWLHNCSVLYWGNTNKTSIGWIATEQRQRVLAGVCFCRNPAKVKSIVCVRLSLEKPLLLIRQPLYYWQTSIFVPDRANHNWEMTNSLCYFENFISFQWKF